MSGRGSFIRKLIPAAIFIVLEIAAVSILKSSSSIQNVWMNKLSHSFLSATWGFGENVREYFSLKKQNDELAAENFRLSEELNKYKEVVSEEKLSAYFNGKKISTFSYIPATIVKLSRNSQHNYIIVDKGSEDGILPQSGIITNNGVIGIIEAVDKHYSYGLSFQNTKISVSARIGKSGFVNSLAWDGISGNKAKMTDIPPYVEMAPGDTVWTSGFSSVFPGDIMLGTIDKITEKAGSYSARISLFQDFSALRYVTIVSNSAVDEVESLELKTNEQ